MPLLESDHNIKNERTIVLKVKEGKTAVSSTGLLDGRLFTNENNLKAVMDTSTCLWSFKYDSGIVPAPMKGKWTSFSKMMEWAKGYFDRRNVEIVNVLD